jgi:hypothetical protein
MRLSVVRVTTHTHTNVVVFFLLVTPTRRDSCTTDLAGLNLKTLPVP